MSERLPSSALSRDLKNKFYDARSELERFAVVRGGLQYVLLSVAALSAFGLVDYFMPLHMAVRAAVVLGLLLLGFVGLVRWLKHRESIDDLVAAKALEHANPQFGQRLRTAHQFESAQDGPAPKLTTALIVDTNSLASNVTLTNPIRWRALSPWLIGVGAFTLLLLVVLVVFGETRVTLARMLLVPIHYSHLDVADPETIVAGADATITAVATGRPLKQVELWVREAKATEWDKVLMLPNGVDPKVEADELPQRFKGELTATIEACQSDMVFKIVASPLPVSQGKLTVLQPLKQQSFLATVDPPSYTRTEKRTVTEMELTAVEGSLVAWELNLNREPASAKLVSTDSGNHVLPAITIQGKKLVCDLAQLEQSTSYEVQAEAADGMKFTSDRIRIRVKKDRGPTVVFQKPKDELEVTATTEVGLNVRITDDFGLGKVGVEYQINGSERKTLWEQDLAGDRKEFTTMPVMYLEEHELTHEDAITYYAFAEDNRDEPKRTRSELQFIDIRPYKREYQMVNGSCQGGAGDCLSLAELIKRQRHTLRRTFANLDRQPIQDALSKRLARSQREIQAATEEFTAGWERKFGPMPMLHSAVTAMEQAAHELDQKALDPAMPLEESALVDLIKAKQNARKFLKNCNSAGQFSQCINYDTAMVQKIRLPERKDDAAAKRIAQAREQVQQMAEQQKRFSEQVAASQGGAKLEKEANPAPKSGTKPSSNPSQQGQSPQQSQGLAQAQRAAAQRAQQMQQTMEGSDVATELAQQKMNEAADRIAQSAREMQEGDELAAAEQARQAAELLEQLDEHLQGLSEPDLAKRLAIAEQMASRLAIGESQVARSLESQGADDESEEKTELLSETQDRLASQAETLADLLRHLEADALGDDVELRRGLGDIQSEHEPEQVARDMQQVARQIGEQHGKAVSGAQRAAGELGDIASALGLLRRSAMQPQLDRLMAAEAKAAELLQSIKASRSAAELTQQYEDLQAQLAELDVSTKEAIASAQIQPSVGQHRAAAVGSHGGATTGPEFFYAGRLRNAELRRVLNVLQARIQDAILLTARMDADEPVPAKYRELVNEYYQALSDDLR